MNELAVINEIGIERAPDLEFQHHFKGFQVHPSECNVKIWVFGGKAFTLFTDIGKGTSVTNASEQIVEEIYERYLNKFSKENCFFAETYQGKKEAIDLVVPRWNGDYVCDVEWKHLGIKID